MHMPVVATLLEQLLLLLPAAAMRGAAAAREQTAATVAALLFLLQGIMLDCVARAGPPRSQQAAAAAAAAQLPARQPAAGAELNRAVTAAVLQLSPALLHLAKQFDTSDAEPPCSIMALRTKMILSSFWQVVVQLAQASSIGGWLILNHIM
jgi:hypothetical protein